MGDLEHKIFSHFDDNTVGYLGHGDDTVLGDERPYPRSGVAAVAVPGRHHVRRADSGPWTSPDSQITSERTSSGGPARRRPAGARLVEVIGREVLIWLVDEERIEHRLSHAHDAVDDVAVGPNALWAAVLGDGRAEVVVPHGWSALRTCVGHHEHDVPAAAQAALDVAFSPDSRRRAWITSPAAPGRLRVVDTASHGSWELAVGKRSTCVSWTTLASKLLTSTAAGGFHRASQHVLDRLGVVLSMRRVKKGPGRRPQSAKRQRFTELRARGWSVAAAAREVGVSRTTGANWSRGYKTYRNGEVVGFVAPLERLAVREVSSRYLAQDERFQIADLNRAGMSVRAIAAELGRAPSTISRELRRNATAGGGYGPFEAHRQAVARRARHHRRRLDANAELRELVAGLLAQRWSPPQIARHLRARFPDQPGMRLCHESIYQAFYQPGSTLVRPSTVPAPGRSPLRSGRDHRRAQQRGDRRRPRFAGPMLSVHQRPFPPEDRAQAGHWEGDLIVGRDHASAIGTLVERRTRLIRLLHLPTVDATSLHRALVARMGDLPAGLLRSITWDQGTEMARHLEITAELGLPVYFCDPHAPWQRGTNENSNGLLRQYFPKRTDLGVHGPEHLAAVENEINTRPRLVLADHTPAALFQALLASPDQQRCDVP